MFTVASTISFVNIALTLPCCLKLMYQCIRLLDGVMSGAHGVALRLLVGPSMARAGLLLSALSLCDLLSLESRRRPGDVLRPLLIFGMRVVRSLLSWWYRRVPATW